jgi:diacylglycerol kinase (ATP)
MMPKSNRRGFGRLVAATGFSMAGFRAAWRGEEAFRQEVMLAAVLVPAAIWLGQTMLQRALLVGTCLLVLVVELLNSAVEAVVDRVGDELHVLSGQAKDMGSAAVLLSLALTVLVWAAVAWDRFAA